MEPSIRSFLFWTGLAGLAALALALASPAARADVSRTGDEPWYGQVSADARARAGALFEQAFEKHQQLLRGEALDLYERALALWDNPDIQWNLALVLDDLGQYLRVYHLLEGVLRWGAALGPERLREVRDRMWALETQRLAQIEITHEEPGAEIKLDGQPWRRRAGRLRMVLLPGEHYITASKPGYLPVTQAVVVKAGEQARAALPMAEDRLIEQRRWPAWKPWATVAAGVAVAAVGAELERRARAQRDAAVELIEGCDRQTCPTVSVSYDRAHGIAMGAFAAGGAAVATGLALAWLNRPRLHRAEARPSTQIEISPILSPRQAALSALVHF